MVSHDAIRRKHRKEYLTKEPRRKLKKDGATWRQQSACEGWQHRNRANPPPARSKQVPVRYAYTNVQGHRNSQRTSIQTMIVSDRSVKISQGPGAADQ